MCSLHKAGILYGGNAMLDDMAIDMDFSLYIRKSNLDIILQIKVQSIELDILIFINFSYCW